MPTGARSSSEMNLAQRVIGRTRKFVASDLFTWDSNIRLPLKAIDSREVGHNLRWRGKTMCIYVLGICYD